MHGATLQQPPALPRSCFPKSRKRNWRKRKASQSVKNLLVAISNLLLLGTSTQPASADVTKEVINGPIFLEPIGNVVVPSGRDVRLACVVDHLGSYKVAWILQNRSAILAVARHVITRNPRIEVNHDGHRTWFLSVRDVKPSDAGSYMCQINTEPVRSQTGKIDVVVPPYIKDDMTSRDVRVKEGDSVILACSARGSPVPMVKWTREDGSDIRINNTKYREVQGPLLHLSSIQRESMGAYLCIASNGVPPSVSKRIKVEVKFQPRVQVAVQLVGILYSSDAVLDCYIESWPPGLNYWVRPNGIQIIHSDEKYEVNAMKNEKFEYTTHMTLKVRRVTSSDIGRYVCVANNSQGGAEQSVNLAAVSGGTGTKEISSGKPALPTENWSRDKDSVTGFDKIPFREHRNSQQQQYPSRPYEGQPKNRRSKTLFGDRTNGIEDDAEQNESSFGTLCAHEGVLLLSLLCIFFVL